MRVGFVGCGKLGLMVALTVESVGHQVMGYDISNVPKSYLINRYIPFKEEHSEELLSKTSMEMVSLKELCGWADILFLSPQTPHESRFEGSTPLPKDRADFDYSFLIECVKSVNECLCRPTTCVIISTVLPGTIERDLFPIIGKWFRLVYQPLFIAMGTVYNDFLNPEFVLCGSNDGFATANLKAFYSTIHSKPVLETDIRTAEGIKVFYNTFITAKTVLANLYGELAHRLGMNVDDIYQALCMSTDRLLSPKYIKSGMGDGGGCHPRDNIALSYIAQREGLSFDLFTALMTAREKHCEWLADLCEQESEKYGLPIIILGKAFKPETNIETGSPSMLLYNILAARNCNQSVSIVEEPSHMASVYFIGCQHKKYANYVFPKGSVIIDPFRYIPLHDSYKVIPIGNTSDMNVSLMV